MFARRTVDEAIAYLRRQAATAEKSSTSYALNSDRRLMGVVSFRDLFSAHRQARIEVMPVTSDGRHLW